MGFLDRVARAVAGDLARQTASKYAPGGVGNGAEDKIIDDVLRQLALSLKLRGWSIDKKTCAFCRGTSRLRTGVLPHVGALLYCQRCEAHYRALKDNSDDTHKIHYDDGRGESICGIGVVTTRDRAKVTCRRCTVFMR